MKTVLNLIAVCTLVALVGCSSTKSNSVAPGAVGECGTNCATKCCGDKASMGAVGVGDKAGCCKSQAECAAKCAGEKVSPGAVGDTKSECQKVCPATGAVAPGAVSEKKSGCCATKN